MSYDDSDLTLPLNRARALLGDTSNNASTELLTDDHIEAVLAMYPYNNAIAFMAKGLAARFAQKVSSVGLPGGLAASWAERVKYWENLAEQMLAGGVTASGAFSVASPRADGYAAYQAEQL